MRGREMLEVFSAIVLENKWFFGADEKFSDTSKEWSQNKLNWVEEILAKCEIDVNQ